MTESAFPFGAPQGDAVPVPELPTTESPNRRMLFLVGGAAGFLVLVVAAYFLFSGGGASDESVPVVQHQVTSSAGSKSKQATKKLTVPQTFNDVVSRDPFAPLYTAPVAAPADAGSAAGAASTGGPTTVGTSTTSSGSASDSTAPARGKEIRVSLVNISTKNGQVYAETVVGDKTYNPAVGDTFATWFRLLSVNGKTATYVEGDEQFSLSEGQQILR